MRRGVWTNRICSIYCITHTESGLIYVGQSRHTLRRWMSHATPGKKRPSLIAAAIALHGIAAFTFRVLEECSAEALSERERWWIRSLGALGPTGYNRTRGGGAAPKPKPPKPPKAPKPLKKTRAPRALCLQ